MLHDEKQFEYIYWIRRFILLIALLASLATTVAIGAHARGANTHTSHSATIQTMKQPFSVALTLNAQNAVIFNPNTISCYATVSCLNITNTTTQTIDLYLNGIFNTSLSLGNIANVNFNVPGTDTFTIPKTNPAAQLTVTVKQRVVPNVNLKVNTLVGHLP